jgi:predicted porin
MKKSLLALAVLGAFAGAASAQTSVTIYGLIDASVGYIDDDVAGKAWSVNSGQMSGSRLGFRGTEDLGGGLSAIFTLENGFSVDAGTFGQSGRNTTSGGATIPGATRLFGRQAWVGLQGGFGAVRLGRQNAPVYVAAVATDPFAASNQHGNARVFGSGLYNQDPFLRADNTLSYTSPNFNGLTATVGYSFGEQSDTASSFAARRTQHFGASYVNGPINAQFAYINTRGVSNFASTDFAEDQVKSYLIGGSYDLGVVKPFVSFASTKLENAGVPSEKIRNYQLGLSAPVGAAGTVLASWYHNDQRDVTDGEANSYSIGYVHNLSKRTNLYTSLSLNKADANGGITSVVEDDEDRKVLNIGIRHSF